MEETGRFFMKNLERIAYDYRIMRFEEIDKKREFAVCDVLLGGKILHSNQFFRYEIIESHNLINIGDEFTFLLDQNYSPTPKNIIVLYRKEDPKKEEVKDQVNIL